MSNNIYSVTGLDFQDFAVPQPAPHGVTRLQSINGNIGAVDEQGNQFALINVDLWTIVPGTKILVSGASRSAGNDDYASAPSTNWSTTGQWVNRINQLYNSLGLSNISVVNQGVGGQTTTTALSLVQTQIIQPFQSNGCSYVILGLDWLVNDIANAISDPTSASNITAILDAIILAVGKKIPIVLITDFALANPTPSERPDDSAALFTKNAAVITAVKNKAYSTVTLVDVASAGKEWETQNNGPINPNGVGLRHGLLITEAGPHLSNAGAFFYANCLTQAIGVGDGKGNLVRRHFYPDTRLGLADGPNWIKRFKQTAQRFCNVLDGVQGYQVGVGDTALAAQRANDGSIMAGGAIKGAAGTRLLWDVALIPTPKTSATNFNLWAVGFWALFGAAGAGNTAELGLSGFGAGAVDVIKFISDNTTFGTNNLQFQVKLSGGTETHIDLGVSSVPDGNPHFYMIVFTGSFGVGGGIITNNTLFATIDGGPLTNSTTTLTNMTNSPVTPYVKDSAGQSCNVFKWAVAYREPYPII